ncbi:MAG: hypothetical protein IJQ02_11915 [Oscillospiraceae bacterium]|nr:hypothetical protein [Oscillospiraceae bacterium]
MKRTISIFLILCLALSLCACGNTSSPAPTQEPINSAAPEAPADPAAEAPADPAVAEEAAAAPAPADESFPKSPINFYVTGNAGSASDTMFRTLASSIESTSGANIVCLTDVWAPNMRATMAAAADGYTICGLPSTNVCKSIIDKTDTEDPNYTDLQVLCAVAQTNVCFGVLAKDERFADVNNLSDFVDWCKANPEEQLLIATKSKSSAAMVALALLIDYAELGDQITILNSSSDGELTTSVLGGNVDAFMTNCGAAQSMYQEGSAKIISIMSQERDNYMPDVPTSVEAGIDVFYDFFYIVCCPQGTPEGVQAKLCEIIKAGVEDSTYVDLQATQGNTPIYRDTEATLEMLSTTCDKLESVKTVLGWG